MKIDTLRSRMDIKEVSVLVIDDVNTMRIQIKELLRGFGIPKVATCSSGEEAKKLLEAGSFQLVLSDWHMAPVDGMELLQWLRAHAKLQETAFIMVTAENTKDRVLDAILWGVDDYIVKPLTGGLIQTRVMGVLKKRKVIA